MTLRHRILHKRMIPLWIGVLSLVLGFPIVGLAMGYGYGHHPSGHSMSPHGEGAYGHGHVHHGMSMSDCHGMGGSLHKPGHGPHQSASEFIGHILKFKDGLGLTDDQATKLQTIKTEFEKTKIRRKADIQLASLDLHELLRDDQGDLSAIESKLKSLFEIRADLYVASVKAGRDAKAVLTDEQRARMKAVHDRIKAYGSKMMKSGHGSDYAHQGKDSSHP